MDLVNRLVCEPWAILDHHVVFGMQSHLYIWQKIEHEFPISDTVNQTVRTNTTDKNVDNQFVPF